MTLAAPFAGFRAIVTGAAIDYNGHMNDAAYAQVLTEANEMFLGAMGLSERYRAETNNSLYTVEMHIRFLREVSEGSEVSAESVLVSHDSKRVRLHSSLLGADGVTVATGESLYLHVDGTTASVVPIPQDRLEVLKEVQRSHDVLPRPTYLGLGVAAPRLA